MLLENIFIDFWRMDKLDIPISDYTDQGLTVTNFFN